MEEQPTYESPTLVEVGNFTDCTLGPGEWGRDYGIHCWLLNC